MGNHELAQLLEAKFASWPLGKVYQQYHNKDGSFKDYSAEGLNNVLHAVGVECEKDMQFVNQIGSLIQKYMIQRQSFSRIQPRS